MKSIISRQIVLVSGLPGTGKTTLAEPLALALGFALITKDYIKENLFDALKGPLDDIPFSRRLGKASMELLWALADRCPQVVLEANFHPALAYDRVQMLATQSQIVEIWCRCSPEVAVRRFTERAATIERHPAHPRQYIPSLESLAECNRPIGIGTVIEVDTNHPVDLEWLVTKVQDVWVSA